MTILAWPRAHDLRHEEADFGRRENSPALCPEPFGELSQEIFVGAAEKVGLHVGQAQPIARIGERLDNEAQLRWIDVALAIALGGEIDDVDDAGKTRILFDDRARRFRQMLADVFGLRALASLVDSPFDRLASADRAPSRLRRQVEADRGNDRPRRSPARLRDRRSPPPAARSRRRTHLKAASGRAAAADNP